MYAFVDETGNTGANIFDESQPNFYTGALITKSNFDVVWGSALRSLCRDCGIEAIHASVLGLGPIEMIAPGILPILKKADARFFMSRVEKRYLLATKIFDTFFDSGENPAVSWMTYNVRFLRLVLCFKVASITTDEIARKFWDMLMAKKETAARAMIPGICDALLARAPLLPDQRSRDIVIQTLDWSRTHPEALDIFIPGRQAKNGHMPNMVAFVNLLDGLEHMTKRWKRPLRKIVHDRQSQFEGTLEEWHRMYSNASDEPLQRPGETIVLQKVKGSKFEVSASDASPGIQIADVTLWLYRQMLAGRPLPEHSAKLLDYVLKKGWHSDFSFDGVGHILETRYEEMMEADISDEAIAEGARLLELSEQRRQQAITLYEQDGLMPYQRERMTTHLPQEESPDKPPLG